METNLAEFRFLKVSEVANILNVSKAHVYNLISCGELPSVRIGRSKRVRFQDLDSFIHANLRPLNSLRG